MSDSSARHFLACEGLFVARSNIFVHLLQHDILWPGGGGVCTPYWEFMVCFVHSCQKMYVRAPTLIPNRLKSDPAATHVKYVNASIYIFHVI